MPDKAQSVFPRKKATAAPKKRKEKPTYTIRRETRIVLQFPDADLLTVFQKALVEAECPVEVARDTRTLTLPGQYDATLRQIIKRLGSDYTLILEEQA